MSGQFLNARSRSRPNTLNTVRTGSALLQYQLTRRKLQKKTCVLSSFSTAFTCRPLVRTVGTGGAAGRRDQTCPLQTSLQYHYAAVMSEIIGLSGGLPLEYSNVTTGTSRAEVYFSKVSTIHNYMVQNGERVVNKMDQHRC